MNALTPRRVDYLWTTVLLAILAGSCAAEQPQAATAPSSTSASAPDTRPATVQYQLPAASVQFDYPGDWHPITGTTTLTLAPVADDHGGQRYIEFDYPDLPLHIPGMISVGMVQGGFVNDLKHRATNVKVTDAPFILPGASAKMVQATGVQDNKPLAITAILAIRHDRVYVFDAESDPDFAADAKAVLLAMVDSVKWTK